MKFFTFHQDVPLMKILTPNCLKKLRSEKISYCLVKPVLKKLVKWVMRSSETDIVFEKQVLKKFLPTLQKIPQFHLISWCGNFVERHSLCTVLCDSPETMRKLRLSTKLPYQEIRWNYSIFCSVGKNLFNTCFSREKMSVSDDFISHVTNFLRTGLTRQ